MMGRSREECPESVLDLSASALRSTPGELATKNGRVSQREGFPFLEMLR